MDRGKFHKVSHQQKTQVINGRCVMNVDGHCVTSGYIHTSGSCKGKCSSIPIYYFNSNLYQGTRPKTQSHPHRLEGEITKHFYDL